MQKTLTKASEELRVKAIHHHVGAAFSVHEATWLVIHDIERLFVTNGARFRRSAAASRLCMIASAIIRFRAPPTRVWLPRRGDRNRWPVRLCPRRAWPCSGS